MDSELHVAAPATYVMGAGANVTTLNSKTGPEGLVSQNGKAHLNMQGQTGTRLCR